MTVIDATAGLGRDAALMTLAGCHVTALERSPIIAALLQDGLDRAGAALAGLRVVRQDALHFIAEIPDADRPDVIYLDPMFPHRTKSALVSKEMRLCRLVTGDDPDAAQLLDLARSKARSRIVVKRPLRAPTLDGSKPAFDYRGKAVRFDVYLPR
jgi:16S rRNA (guanine1516-N2)-methyltransferase